MRTAIIGLGITGYSCVEFLHGRDELLVVDSRDTPPQLQALNTNYPDVRVVCGAVDFDPAGFDRVIVSPGISLDSCLLRHARDVVPFVSDIDLFCEAAQAPLIAITGTNGKSTVTALVGHLLNHSGRRVPVGGNLGDAALALLDNDADAYVLELSSFQLERMRSHHFAAASILNLSEDHLDRHGDMPTYVASKHRIYADCGIAVANRAEPETLPQQGFEQLVTFGPDQAAAPNWGIVEHQDQRYLALGDKRLTACSALTISGRHNEQNALAACALAMSMGVEFEELAAGLATYQGLSHRCERVALAGGVEFINDSKATNVGATQAALEGLGDRQRRHIVLIAGGDGKGADFSPLREPVAAFVKRLIVLGKDKHLLAQVMTDVVTVEQVSDMEQAVAAARNCAEQGDIVLLSPACASLDMYPNFAARGDDFTRQVRSA